MNKITKILNTRGRSNGGKVPIWIIVACIRLPIELECSTRSFYCGEHTHLNNCGMRFFYLFYDWFYGMSTFVGLFYSKLIVANIVSGFIQYKNLFLQSL